MHVYVCMYMYVSRGANRESVLRGVLVSEVTVKALADAMMTTFEKGFIEKNAEINMNADACEAANTIADNWNDVNCGSDLLEAITRVLLRK